MAPKAAMKNAATKTKAKTIKPAMKAAKKIKDETIKPAAKAAPKSKAKAKAQGKNKSLNNLAAGSDMGLDEKIERLRNSLKKGNLWRFPRTMDCQSWTAATSGLKLRQP